MPVMWNSGASAKYTGASGRREAGALPLGVVHDVAVGVGGALGGAAGARGVADQRDVAAGRGRGPRGPRDPARRDGQQVVGVRRLRQPLEVQHPSVVPGLEVQFAGGQHDPYGRVGGGLAQVRLPGAVGADQRGDLAVPQDVADLAGLVHRVDGQDGRAGLPGAEQGEHEVRGVLQHDGDPVAALQAARGEVSGDGVGQLVGLAVGQPAVEVGEGGAVRGLGDGPAQGVHRRAAGLTGPRWASFRSASQGLAAYREVVTGRPPPTSAGGGSCSSASGRGRRRAPGSSRRPRGAAGSGSGPPRSRRRGRRRRPRARWRWA